MAKGLKEKDIQNLIKEKFTFTATAAGEYLYSLALDKKEFINKLLEILRPLFDAYIQILGEENQY